MTTYNRIHYEGYALLIADMKRLFPKEEIGNRPTKIKRSVLPFVAMLPGLMGTMIGLANTVELRELEYEIHDLNKDRKSTRLNSSHPSISRMPSSA